MSKLKLRIKSTHNPILLTCKTKTMIIGGTILTVNGEVWNHAYVAIEPAGVITKDDIEWIPGYSVPELPEPEKVIVRSTDGKREYIVTLYETGGYTCTCDGFWYRKKCKHIHEV